MQTAVARYHHRPNPDTGPIQETVAEVPSDHPKFKPKSIDTKTKAMWFAINCVPLVVGIYFSTVVQVEYKLGLLNWLRLPEMGSWYVAIGLYQLFFVEVI
jgi:hypothetical protein